MKIGFLDSGLGGLLVLKAVAKHLPQYSYEYYGDTKNVPYGDKTENEIYELVKAGVTHLFERDCALVILACNTASAQTLRKLQDKWLPQQYPERRILGVIIPLVEEVVASGVTDVLLLGTKRTIDSKKFDYECVKCGGTEIQLSGIATPELVPLIESGQGSEAAKRVKEIILSRDALPEAVILGCTHYALLADTLREEFDSVKLFTQPDIIPQKLADYLARHPEIENTLEGETRSRNIHLTEHRPDYDAILESLLT